MKLRSLLPTILALAVLTCGLVPGATAEPLVIFEYTAPEIDSAEPLPIVKGEGAGFHDPAHGTQPWGFFTWSEEGGGMALWQAPTAGGIGVGITPFLDGAAADPSGSVQGMLIAPISLATATRYILKISYTSEGDAVPCFSIGVDDNRLEVGGDCELDTVVTSESHDSASLRAPAIPGEWKEAVIPFSIDEAVGNLNFLFYALSSSPEGAVYIRSVKLEVDERH